MTSSRPARRSPAGSWTVTQIDTNGGNGVQFESGSCTSAGLCAVGDVLGRVFVSTDVGTTPGTWTSSQATSAPVTALSCGGAERPVRRRRRGGQPDRHHRPGRQPADLDHRSPAWCSRTRSTRSTAVTYHHLLHCRRLRRQPDHSDQADGGNVVVDTTGGRCPRRRALSLRGHLVPVGQAVRRRRRRG